MRARGLMKHFIGSRLHFLSIFILCTMIICNTQIFIALHKRVIICVIWIVNKVHKHNYMRMNVVAIDTQ